MDQPETQHTPSSPASTQPKSPGPAINANPLQAFPKHTYSPPWAKIALLGISLEIGVSAILFFMLYMLFAGKFGIETEAVSLISIYGLTVIMACAVIFHFLKKWAVDYPFIIAVLTVLYASALHTFLSKGPMHIAAMADGTEKPWVWPALSLIGPFLLIALTFLTNMLPKRRVLIAILVICAITCNIIMYNLDTFYKPTKKTALSHHEIRA